MLKINALIILIGLGLTGNAQQDNTNGCDNLISCFLGVCESGELEKSKLKNAEDLVIHAEECDLGLSLTSYTLEITSTNESVKYKITGAGIPPEYLDRIKNLKIGDAIHFSEVQMDNASGITLMAENRSYTVK